MRSSHSLDRMDTAFDGTQLVADAGLLLPATLAQHLGLDDLVEEFLDLGKKPGAISSIELPSGRDGDRPPRREAPPRSRVRLASQPRSSPVTTADQSRVVPGVPRRARLRAGHDRFR
jgi:hypothetical protein